MELKRIFFLLALCAAPLFAQSAGVTEVSVTFSTTPTFTCNAGVTNFSINLTNNVTSSTFSCAAVAIGSFKICQDNTGNRTFVPPSGAKGFGTIDPTANKCSRQTFKWDGSVLQATGPMVTDGTMPGGIPGLQLIAVIMSPTSPVTVAAVGTYYNNSTGAITYNLPTITTAIVGSQFCFSQAVTRTGVITLQAPASTFFVDAGAAGSSAGTFVSPGALADTACVLAVDLTHYYVSAKSTAWVIT